MMSTISIDPRHPGESFVAVLICDKFQECGLALSGTAEAKEYERGRWSVSAKVLNVDGIAERRVLPDSFTSAADARDLVEHINWPAENTCPN